MARKKAVYYLGQPERIGEACDQINRVRNLYPDSDYDLTIVWPIQRPAANAPLMEILCRGLHTEQVRSREELLAVYQRVQREDPAFLFLDTTRRYEEEYPTVYGDSRTFVASLTAEELEKGQQIRTRLGMPADAQVVTLHVREGGYLPHLAYHNYRDCTIKNYYPAIQYLVDRGYWVVRIGDTTMQKLENFPAQVVDAPFHPEYEPFFDPYFVACSRFYLGVPSGPSSLAHLFRIPILMTNSICHPNPLTNVNTLYVFRNYFSRQLGRNLVYEEIIASPSLTFGYAELFEKSDLHLLENSPDEILNATWEMDTRLAGSYPYLEEAGHIQKHMKSIGKRAHLLRSTSEAKESGLPSPFFHIDVSISLEFIRLNPAFVGHLWPPIHWQQSPRPTAGEPEAKMALARLSLNELGRVEKSVAEDDNSGQG